MASRRNNVTTPTGGKRIQALLDIAPLAVAVIPWGVLCGSLAIQIGLTPLQSQLMSLLVFAGAAQLGALTLTNAGGSLPALMGSTAVVSSRHLLYSASFRQDVQRLSRLQRIALAFFLTDEMFVVAEKKKQQLGYLHLEYAMTAGVGFYIAWNLATFAGIVAGSSFPEIEQLGLEFAIAATFIAMVVPRVKNIPVLIAVLVSAVAAISFSIASLPNGMLLASLLGMLSGFVSELLIARALG